jgi:hypothetical protein
MNAIKTALVASLVVALFVTNSFAQRSYSNPGSVYSENFDSLPTSPENSSLGASPAGWMDDTAAPGAGNHSIVGWYLYHPSTPTEGGFNSHQRMRIGAGTSTTGAFMSWGSSASSDRALGDLGANTLASDSPASPELGNLYIGLRLRNETGQTLGSFTLGFAGEQWHVSTISETMTFGWSTAATAINDLPALFNDVPSLAWTAPVTPLGSGEGASDGNLAQNRVVINPVTVSGLTWLPGTDLWLRWTDVQAAGPRDNGMGLDDLTFSADIVVPEPSLPTLFGLGLAALLLRRK